MALSTSQYVNNLGITGFTSGLVVQPNVEYNPVEAAIAAELVLGSWVAEGMLSPELCEYYRFLLADPTLRDEIVVPTASLNITDAQRAEIEGLHLKGAEAVLSNIFGEIRRGESFGVFLSGGMYASKSYLLCELMKGFVERDCGQVIALTGMDSNGGIFSRINEHRVPCKVLPKGEALLEFLNGDVLSRAREMTSDLYQAGESCNRPRQQLLLAIDEASWDADSIRTIVNFIDENALKDQVRLVVVGLNADIKGAATPLEKFAMSQAKPLQTIQVPTYRVPPNGGRIHALKPGYTTRFVHLGSNEFPAANGLSLIDLGLVPVVISREEGYGWIQYAPLPSKMLPLIWDAQRFVSDERANLLFAHLKPPAADVAA